MHRDGRLTVTDAERGERELPADYVREHVELGYATTGYGAQGDTATDAHLVLTEHTTAAAAYVGMTRGREANTAHLVAATSTTPASSGSPRSAATGPTSARRRRRRGRPCRGRLPPTPRPADPGRLADAALPRGATAHRALAAAAPAGTARTGPGAGCLGGALPADPDPARGRTRRHAGRRPAGRTGRHRLRRRPHRTRRTARRPPATVLGRRPGRRRPRRPHPRRRTWPARHAPRPGPRRPAAPRRLGGTWAAVFAGSDLDPRRSSARPLPRPTSARSPTPSTSTPTGSPPPTTPSRPPGSCRPAGPRAVRRGRGRLPPGPPPTRTALPPARLRHRRRRADPRPHRTDRGRAAPRRPADQRVERLATDPAIISQPDPQALLEAAHASWAAEQIAAHQQRRSARPSPFRSIRHDPHPTQQIDHGPSLGADRHPAPNRRTQPIGSPDTAPSTPTARRTGPSCPKPRPPGLQVAPAAPSNRRRPKEPPTITTAITNRSRSQTTFPNPAPYACLSEEETPAHVAFRHDTPTCPQ